MDTVVANKVEQFFSNYKVRRYSKGQVLILNGDNTTYIYYILSGRVKMYDVTYRGDEVILNIFKFPAFFPVSMALNETIENKYIYEAETDIEIRQAPTGDVVEFLKANPDVTLNLLARIYRGTEGLIGRIAQLMSGSAQSRLIYELILEARRFGIKDTTEDSYTLHISEKDLGARAGLSRETVSREVSKLKSSGLITVKTHSIHIHNMKKLEQKLGQVI